MMLISSLMLMLNGWIGLCFFLLGALKLGVIIGFFPRHILVGCVAFFVLDFKF